MRTITTITRAHEPITSIVEHPMMVKVGFFSRILGKYMFVENVFNFRKGVLK